MEMLLGLKFNSFVVGNNAKVVTVVLNFVFHSRRAWVDYLKRAGIVSIQVGGFDVTFIFRFIKM